MVGGNEIRTGLKIVFPLDLRYVGLDRTLADGQPIRDPRIRQACRDQAIHFLFARCERRESVLLRDRGRGGLRKQAQCVSL